MREGVLSLREQGFAARRPVGFVERHRAAWLLAGGTAVLLGGVGAFDTGNAAPWTRYSYWLLLSFAGCALGAVGADRLEALGVRLDRPSRPLLAAFAAVTVAMTPLVYLLSALALNGGWGWERLPHLWSQVLIVAAVLLPLQLAMEGSFYRVDTAARPEATGRPALAARLPARLRQAAIEAVEAEDHYLRIHTSEGSALVLMRLSDAIEELAGLEGRRTHRSWWVARGAVTDTARGRGRALLTLRSGIQAPVSRTYAPLLRRDGWY